MDYNEHMIFLAEDEDGHTVECEALFTFESKETGKNYIAYTDNTLDDEGNTKVFASIYDANDEHTKLFPIETEQEWFLIETLLNHLQNKASDGDF